MTLDKRNKIELIIYIVIIVILLIWFSYYQVKLFKRQQQIENIETEYNEITKGYEKLKNDIENL